MEGGTGGPRGGGAQANTAAVIEEFPGSTRKRVKNIPFNPNSKP